jgi:hypothetical protein
VVGVTIGTFYRQLLTGDHERGSRPHQRDPRGHPQPRSSRS